MPEQEDKGSDTMSHQAGVKKGEEQADQKKEDGHVVGGRTAGDSTTINPEDEKPIDPAMPSMPPA